MTHSPFVTTRTETSDGGYKANNYLIGDFSSSTYSGKKPILPIGKKLYMLLDGKLVAFKAIALGYCNYIEKDDKWSNGISGHGWTARLEIAGQGTKDFKYFNADVFESVEHYQSYMLGTCKNKVAIYKEDVDVVSALQDIGVKFVFTPRYYYVGYYTAIKGTTRIETIPMRCDIWYDEEGLHCEPIRPCSDSDCNKEVFPTKELALKNAMVTNVVDFADDEEEPKRAEEHTITLRIKGEMPKGDLMLLALLKIGINAEFE